MDMDAKRWRALGRLPVREVVASLAADPLPAAVRAAHPGAPWGPHSKMSIFQERPGSLLSCALWFGNGLSATVVYGCRDGFAVEWSESLSGPWPLWLGVAARVGDEARCEMLACFGRGDWPELHGSPISFGEDGPGLDLGSRAAFVELCSPEGAIEALRLISSMPSAWDHPAQAPLWAAARGSELARFESLLSQEPDWAWRPWSRGSSLGALCARLGRWDALGACARIGGAPSLAGAAVSRALAEFCRDVSPSWPLGAAPKGLERAMRAGAPLDLAAWIECFGSSKAGSHQALLCWMRAESSLLSGCAAAAGLGRSKRI